MKILKNGYNLKQRFITCGGEALQGVVSDEVQVVNEYGPTEFTCTASYFKLERGVEYSTIPIGRPSPNCYCFLLDNYGNLVAQGVKGEICLAGPQISAGYWNRPELTAEKFIEVQIGAEKVKVYRTGDLGYYDKDGQLIYVGRIDFQVKLHGFRIELGEIESRAIQYPGIKMVNAQVKKDRLVLYYTADRRIDKDDFKAFLAETLTDYMVPTVYIELEKMPMTPNGKIDRKALPEPDLSSLLQNEQPANKLEENCLKIAREVLKNSDFGVTDDLTTVGLNSLNSMQLTARLTSELRLKLRVSDVMRYKTIRGFLQGKHRIAWLYEKYDENKPTVVFVQGIVRLEAAEHLHRLFSESFNVVVIEPIQNHHDRIFFGEHLDDVVNFYVISAGLLLPRDVKIAALMGFSFGGAVAFDLAKHWQEMSGNKAPVIMGDTTLPKSGKLPPEEIKLVTAEKLQEMVDAFEVQEHEYTKEEIDELVRVNNIVVTICSENSLKPYDGEVIFLNAHLNATEKMMHDKMTLLHEYAPQAEIYDFPDYSHAGIFTLETMHPFYRTLIKKLLAEN